MPIDKTHFCGRSWCVKDPCGLTCVVIIWLSMLFGEFCVVTIMMSSLSTDFLHQAFNAFVFHLLIFMAFSSHWKTMLTNPGTVPKGNATDEFIRRIQNGIGPVLSKCTKCCSVKPERAHHCSVCGCCVRRMDHHCPWVNNCVGEGNQRYFVLFTMYVSLLSFHGLYWTFWQLLLCLGKEWENCSSFGPAATAIFLVLLIFLAILFAVFALIMFGTQMSAICSDQTGIESLKRPRSKMEKDGWKNLQIVFGGPLSLKWFNPFFNPYQSKISSEYSV